MLTCWAACPPHPGASARRRLQSGAICALSGVPPMPTGSLQSTACKYLVLTTSGIFGGTFIEIQNQWLYTSSIHGPFATDGAACIAGPGDKAVRRRTIAQIPILALLRMQYSVPFSIILGTLKTCSAAARLFSIDPPTARDLDDALSIEELGNGRVRIGVHIADVSHFIPPGSALDAKAAQRATSVYLTQRVIPMLPPLLCEELCSLNPGACTACLQRSSTVPSWCGPDGLNRYCCCTKNGTH